MPTFTPRLTSSGMLNNPYWYDPNMNPFYPTYGLPNCTCYAWGRWYEITGQWPGLPTGDAGSWFANDSHQHGTTPKLGAIICLGGGPYSGRGHVAVVEKIYSNGTVVFSNSAYDRNPQTMPRSYFYTRQGTINNQYGYSEYTFQGFIYNSIDFDPDVDPDDPPDPGPQPPEPEQYPTRLLLYKKQFYKNQGRLIDDFYH